MNWMHTHRDFLSAGLLVLLAAGLWMYSGSFPQLEAGYPGPALFPRLIALGLGLSGLLLGIQSLRSRQASAATAEPAAPAGPWPWLRMAGGIGGVVLFPYLHEWLGFVPALFVVCLAVALLMRVRLWAAGLTALGAAAVIYVLFTQLLSVPL
ncbi:MAG: tripartite tricarboxylate transporter TctB family protein [Bacteroidetes bacterium]|nr:MAG: tripartite tricarboxylate transporter TctB family protein [Bacteroidota bacterium]